MPLKESEFHIPNDSNSNRSAHTVVANVRYADDTQNEKGRYFVKYNKHGNAVSSILEAGFSAIASVCLLPGLMPPMELLCDNHSKVIGLISRDVGEVVKKYGQDTKKVRFLSQIPKGDFQRRLDKYKDGQSKAVDWNSLASVLCSSYFLEEDDLHRDNVVCFVKKQDGKKLLCFAKIDNDLCYSNSIMSRHAVRFWNLRHNSHSFDITRTDLLCFPNLKNYGTHYWPTRYSFLAKPFDKKIYDNLRDISAFSSLEHHPDFIEAKWRQFYRLVLLPETHFAKSLTRVLDTTNAEHKAYYDQILNATIAKQQALAACLFSMKPFRDWLEKSQFDSDFFSASLGGMAPQEDPQDYQGEMRMAVVRHKKRLEHFVDGDTPFHAALRLDLYRFDQTWHDYGRYSKIKNAQGDTPASLLLKHCLRDSNQVCPDSLKRALADMHARGEYQDYSPNLITEIKKLKPVDYFNSADVSSVHALYEHMHRISEDTALTLKMKKNHAIQVFQAFLSHNQDKGVLIALKKDLSEKPCFAFIRLLQSRFWIFRYFRTLLLRGTTTFRQINRSLEDAIERSTQHQARP